MERNRHIQLKNGKTVSIENIREINKWIEFLRKFEFQRKSNMYQAKNNNST